MPKYVLCNYNHRRKIFELESGSIVCPCCGNTINHGHAMSSSIQTLFDICNDVRESKTLKKGDAI